MDDPSSESIPPELQVSMDAEFTVAGLASYANQQKLESVLVVVPGVETLNFIETSVAIRYDPEQVSKAELCAIIEQSGFRVEGAESAPAEPPIEPSEDDR